ncbi:MAG: hypothetical protein JWL87_230 [Candidatus Adlerbacteria bacterium]|nr:hypothetical protein [Candidatus Adlerbacteria bacterium]
MQAIKNFLSYLNSFSRRSKIIAAAVLVVALIVLTHLGGSEAPVEGASTLPHVEIASVASLSDSGAPLPVVGRVTSVSQANITAIGGGQITSLPAKLGNRVAAGSILASFENSSQRAAVLQAQGSYDAAVASQQSVSPEDSRTAAVNAYRSAFTTLDTVLESQIDTFFGAPGPYGPQLLIDAPNYDYGELSRDRAAITQTMQAYRSQLASADAADPAALLAEAQRVTQEVSDFITKLAVAANRRESRASEDQLAALNAARASVNSLSATLTTAAQSYRSGSVGSTASTDASITIALGGLRAAQASLEKTYVRAPISGTIVSLPVHLGDNISPGAQVAIISNPGALQIEAYVTPQDAKTLAVGGKATVEGTIPATIVFVAPALDPTTGKIQVKLGFSGDASALSDGSSVSVTLNRSAAGATQKATQKSVPTIPIAAAKITPEGPVVFTVASSTLVAHPVTFGAIVGGQVAITLGLTLDMDIVIDARGLSEGQQVVVDSN